MRGVALRAEPLTCLFRSALVASLAGHALGNDMASAAEPAAATNPLPEVFVIATTPVPGTAIDIDRIPGNVQILSGSDLARDGSASLTGALNSNLSSVHINDDLDDPFQPDLLYRGFEASPVLGTPQGLAVYQNGVRINEAFGDTVNWDLLTDVAVDEVRLLSASPLYGLNALGGAISVTMKNGFTYQGGNLELSGGSYGRRSAVAQYGGNSGGFGIYVAARALDSVGWREFSDDRIRTFYTALSYHSNSVQLDLSYTGAQNQLNGQGAAPIQELAVNRSLVFTGPQANVNDLNFLALNGALQWSRVWSLQGVLYYRHFAQIVSNGNTTNYTACVALPGVLCQPDGVTPLTNSAGQSLADLSRGGTVPIGENDFERIAAWGRGGTLQFTSTAAVFGLPNQLSIGVAIDDASTNFYSAAEIGILNPQLLVLPSNLYVYTPENSPAAIANGDALPVSVDSVNRNLGAYFTDVLNVTPSLAITASGRYNVAQIDLADQLGANLSGDNRFVHFNPALGATYKLDPKVTLYGGVSTNTRTPTASEIECSNPLTPCLLPTNLAGDPPRLREVVSHTIEAGLRGPFAKLSGGDRQISWNLSVFRTLLQDDIYGIATSVSQGFFQNIGDTLRQGFEAGLNFRGTRWSAFANYSFVQATFRSPLLVPSPLNPDANPLGDLKVLPGDRLPGIPAHRLKLGADYKLRSAWTIGTTLNAVSHFYYVGDESNQLAPIPGYFVVNLHSSYRPVPHLELFASVNNLLDRKYATWGILGDPTGIGAPGIPAARGTNGPGVNNRFLSPAAPLEVFAGFRISP